MSPAASNEVISCCTSHSHLSLNGSKNDLLGSKWHRVTIRTTQFDVLSVRSSVYKALVCAGRSLAPNEHCPLPGLGVSTPTPSSSQSATRQPGGLWEGVHGGRCELRGVEKEGLCWWWWGGCWGCRSRLDLKVTKSRLSKLLHGNALLHVARHQR